MTRSSLWLATASLLVLSTPARADEVVLQDGRTVYGSIEERGSSLAIATREGEVVVPRIEVVRVRKSADLRAELVGLAARCGKLSPFSCLHLANTARDWALPQEMWDYLDRALAQGAIPADIQGRLDEFLATLEPELLAGRWRKSTAATKAREILLTLSSKDSPSRRAAAARVLAGLSGIDAELRTRARALNAASQRSAANEALWLRPDNDVNRKFVLRSAIYDDAPDVRAKVVDLAVAGRQTRAAADYLAQWLAHSHPKAVMRAADALGELGEPSAADAMVKAAPYVAAGSEGGTRAHAAFITQQAYVKDYDVEVAQSAFIADPKVDALTYGSVLDVRIGAVVTQRVQIIGSLRRAIAKLEGADPGEDVSKWEAWLAARRGVPQR
jgi:hypothetical protein